MNRSYIWEFCFPKGFSYGQYTWQAGVKYQMRADLMADKNFGFELLKLFGQVNIIIYDTDNIGYDSANMTFEEMEIVVNRAVKSLLFISGKM